MAESNDKKRKNSLFREETLDNVSSPDQLNDYIKVTNPGVWMIAVAVIILLLGVIAWGAFGWLETTVTTSSTVQDHTITCYVKESDVVKIPPGAEVRVENSTGSVTTLDGVPKQAGDVLDEYGLEVGELDASEWVYLVRGNIGQQDGEYPATIVVASIHPIEFLLN